jgi:hypothetical protein
MRGFSKLNITKLKFRFPPRSEDNQTLNAGTSTVGDIARKSGSPHQRVYCTKSFRDIAHGACGRRGSVDCAAEIRL